MTTTSQPAATPAPEPVLSPEGYDLNDTTKIPIRGRLRRLMVTLLFGNIGIFIVWGSVPGFLLPTQIQGIDPLHKAADLAIATTLGAIAAMIAQPIAGMVSDRTRSRYGRRAQWMIAGASLALLSLVGMAIANTLVTITIAFFCLQVTMNFAQGPISAIMPDRVPRGVRGTFSAITGLGAMVGSIAGQVYGPLFAKHVPLGYIIAGVVALALVLLFVVLNPDKSSKDDPREPFSVVVFLKTFWVNPVRYPDFFWGFVGRILLVGGYYVVSGYQLYILEDYIKLGSAADSVYPLVGILTLLGVIPASIVGGMVSDRIGRRKPVVLVAGLILAIALIIPWFLPTEIGMLAYGFVSGIGFGGYLSVDQALMTEVLPSQQDFAKDLGVLNIAATLPQVLGPAIAGGIVVFLGGYPVLFPVGLVLAALGALAILRIKSVR